MNRREIITTAAAAAMCAALPAAPAAAAQHSSPALLLAKRLRLACAWPQAAGGTYDAALDMARAVERALDVPVEIIATGEHDPDSDLTFGGEQTYAAQDPALGLIGGLPARFALSPDATARWLTGPGADLWQEAVARTASAITLYAGCEGVCPSLWSRREIESLSGLRIAGAEGVFADLLTAAGATTIAMPQNMWSSAFEAGDIDAAHLASAEDVLTLGVQHHARHCLPGVLTAHGGPLAIRVPTKLWRGFSAAARQTLRRQVAETGSRRHARSANNHDALLAAMCEAHGLTVHSQTPVTLQRTIDRLSEAIVADYSGRDVLCRSLGGASMAQLHAKWKTALCITGSLNVV